MEIRINDQLLDFTLEDERSVGDIADGVSRWLDPAGLVITAGRIGGDDDLAEARERWDNIPLDGVELIEFTVEDLRLLQTAHLRTLRHYFVMVGDSLDAAGAERILEQVSELPELLQGLSTILGPGGPQSVLSTVSAMVRELKEAGAGPLDEPRREQLRAELTRLDALAELVIEEVADPQQALGRRVEQAETAVAAIEEVSVLLQTGDDRGAMQRVVAFADATQGLMRALAHTRLRAISAQGIEIQGVGIDKFYRELNAYLREIAGAFEDMDSVLIGDLLEYEVAPRVHALMEYARGMLDAGDREPHTE